MGRALASSSDSVKQFYSNYVSLPADTDRYFHIFCCRFCSFLSYVSGVIVGEAESIQVFVTCLVLLKSHAPCNLYYTPNPPNYLPYLHLMICMSLPLHR